MLKALTFCDQICQYAGAIKTSFIYSAPDDAAEGVIRWRGGKYKIRVDFIEEAQPPVCDKCGHTLENK